MTLKPYIFGVAAAAILLIHNDAPAQIIQKHNSQAPVTIDAGRTELQALNDRVIVSGNVIVTQAGLTLRADRLTAAYSNSTKIDITRLDAIGGVTITKADLRTNSNAAIYDLERNLITLIGNVSVTQGNNKLNGGRIIIDLNQNRTSVDNPQSKNGGTGRIRGTFTVPQRKTDDTDAIISNTP